MRYDNRELRELLAAEYVLGTLKGRARQRFEGLMGASPELRKEVRDWEERLNRLAESAPPIAPPPQAWDALRDRLFPEPAPAPWYERLGFWRGLSLGGGMLAAVLAAFLIVERPGESPNYVVMIHNTNEQPVWMVSTSTDMGRLYVKNLKAMNMPKDVQCLLWVKSEHGGGLFPVGVLPDEGDDAVLEIDEKIRNMLPGKLLVSVEHSSNTPPDEPESPLAYEGTWMPLTEI
jgi:anti-sigma-K factor RskA